MPVRTGSLISGGYVHYGHGHGTLPEHIYLSSFMQFICQKLTIVNMAL